MDLGLIEGSVTASIAAGPPKLPGEDKCRSDLERETLCLISAANITLPEINVKYLKDSQFVADFLWFPERVVLEVDGGQWGVGPRCRSCGQRQNAGHTTGEGMERDRLKDALSQLQGYLILRVTARMLRNGTAINLLKRALEIRRCSTK